MTVEEIKQFLSVRFPDEKVSFIGSGSDSNAFKVGDRICRFVFRGREMYEKEAEVCDAVRPFISVPIPKIELVEDGDIFYVVHKMICGNKWSWHKFAWSPRKQRNLADSLARFLAQLHGVDKSMLLANVPALARPIPYIDFSDVTDYFEMFLSPRQINFFQKNYHRIISAPVADTDMVLVHLGLKGVNSVVDCDGNLCGVFDFGNCGIYERGRDLVLMSLSRNRRLYNRFLKTYCKLSGASVDKNRIADLAVIEFLWAKRWYAGDRFFRLGRHFVKRNLTAALGRFYGVPKCLHWVIYARMCLRERAYDRMRGKQS